MFYTMIAVLWVILTLLVVSTPVMLVPVMWAWWKRWGCDLLLAAMYAITPIILAGGVAAGIVLLLVGGYTYRGSDLFLMIAGVLWAIGICTTLAVAFKTLRRWVQALWSGF
jgi:hypothetical protein